MLGTLLGEFTVHGHDLARTLGKTWPVDPDHVPIIVEGLHQVMPGWVNPVKSSQHSATYEMRLRGLARYVYMLHDGRLIVNPTPPDRIDVHISAEPVTALLLNYGRIKPWHAAITGKVLARGRRPWLAPGLTRRFHAV